MPVTSPFVPALRLDNNALVSIIGGGGKTSMMLSLARAMPAEFPVMVTTTTRIRPPSDIPLRLVQEPYDLPPLPEGLVAAGSGLSDSGKLIGVPPEAVCRWRHAFPGPILVEADGSAGRPLKAHGAHEPVVPAASTHVLMVAGVDALGEPATERTVHRLPQFLEHLGVDEGVELTPELVAGSMLRCWQYVPPGAELVFVLSKVDSAQREAGANKVASNLRARSPGARVLLAAWGHLRPQPDVPAGTARCV